MSTRLHIVVPDELVVRIDAAKHEGQPRADYIRRAVERSLARDDGSAWRLAERDVAERHGLEPPAVERAQQDNPVIPMTPAVHRRAVSRSHSATCKCPVCS